MKKRVCSNVTKKAAIGPKLEHQHLLPPLLSLSPVLSTFGLKLLQLFPQLFFVGKLRAL